jgi:hypothetical protein
MVPPTQHLHMGKGKNGDSLPVCLLSNFSTEIFWRRCSYVFAFPWSIRTGFTNPATVLAE